jgi:hypothetical protein
MDSRSITGRGKHLWGVRRIVPGTVKSDVDMPDQWHIFDTFRQFSYGAVPEPECSASPSTEVA